MYVCRRKFKYFVLFLDFSQIIATYFLSDDSLLKYIPLEDSRVCKNIQDMQDVSCKPPHPLTPKIYRFVIKSEKNIDFN